MKEGLRLALRRALAVCLAIGLGAWAWDRFGGDGGPEGVTGGNGRTEAVEVDIAPKTAGRIAQILVDEGDMLSAGDVVARMDVTAVQAQLHQAEAALRQARLGVRAAASVVLQAGAEEEAARAVVAQNEAARDAARKSFARAGALAARGAASESVRDDAEAAFLGAEAAVAAARAAQAAAAAGEDAAKAQKIAAEAGVASAAATVERIRADLADAVLTAPRAGRVQYRVAQPGEVVGAGAPILNMVDLSDMHVTFFLPTAEAGRLALGEEARIVLDAAPDMPIPARIAYVSDVAQFTPRSVETAEERAKLMFRVKARIDPALLARFETHVKTGLPGMVWVRTDPSRPWPEALAAEGFDGQ